MSKEYYYILACISIINKVIDRGSHGYATRVDGKWEMIPLVEILGWLYKLLEYEYMNNTIQKEIEAHTFDFGRILEEVNKNE